MTILFKCKNWWEIKFGELVVCQHQAKLNFANCYSSYTCGCSFGTHLSVVCIWQQDKWLQTMQEPPACLNMVPLLSDNENTTEWRNEVCNGINISWCILITSKLLSAYFNFEQSAKSNFCHYVQLYGNLFFLCTRVINTQELAVVKINSHKWFCNAERL